MTFRAVMAEQEDGKIRVSFQDVERERLPQGEVLTRVEYSSLNYKDGLAVTGRPGVIRKFPMIPGIDYTGVVEESSSPEYKPGDRVLITACVTSETVWGGYAQLARLDAQYIVPLPSGMTPVQAMGIGTAGFTAMQSVMALEAHGLKPAGKPVLVTGAAGGVGSAAVAILAKLGYTVAASSGRPELSDYLRGLGAAEIVARETISAPSKKPLETERWAAAVDTVGGDTLAGVLRSIQFCGSVAACGLAGGSGLPTTVMPFILRGVNLLGINALAVTNADRRNIWARLAADLPFDKLDAMIQVEPLSRVFELGERILAGQVRGRVVLDVNA